jgi:ribosome biogenesis GTP-binding protein YlqF
MAKAVRMMEAEIKKVDSVIYVLDARAPVSSVNPAFDQVLGNKSRLYVLNKADLSDRKELSKWRVFFEKDGNKCITANSSGKSDAPLVVKSLRELNAPLIEKYARKGVNKVIRAMVIGIPNSGKSTLINSLISEKKAATGDKPGVTRGKQWITVDKNIELMDVPGVLYPDFSDQDKALKLALIGSVNDDILDVPELAAEGIKFLAKSHPQELFARYPFIKDFPEPLPALAKGRGYILKGGEPDTERAAKAFISDFRKGLLGKIILEKML